MFGEFTLFKHLAEKSLVNESRSAKWLLIVTTNLDGFSLTIRQIRQTFLLYDILFELFL